MTDWPRHPGPVVARRRALCKPLAAKIPTYRTEIGSLELFECPISAPLKTRLTEAQCTHNRKRAKDAKHAADLGAIVHMRTCLRCPGAVALAAGKPLPPDAPDLSRELVSAAELSHVTGIPSTPCLEALARARRAGTLKATVRGHGQALLYPREAALGMLADVPRRLRT